LPEKGINNSIITMKKQCSTPGCQNEATLQLLGNHPICRACGDVKNAKARVRSAKARARGHYSPSILARKKGKAPSLEVSGVEAEVCMDITARQMLGIAKYGTTVKDNPLSLREWLNHAYQECLDQAIYLKRAMMDLPKD
jgi:hypothetical protein